MDFINGPPDPESPTGLHCHGPIHVGNSAVWVRLDCEPIEGMDAVDGIHALERLMLVVRHEAMKIANERAKQAARLAEGFRL